MTSKNAGVIAAGNQKTAQAGADILAQGGNAFDAAVAAMLASCVVESPLTSLAGGGFLLAHTRNNENILFDFFTQTPAYQKIVDHLNFYPVDVDFGGQTQSFHIGLASMATPGNLAGIFAIHKRLGKLSLQIIAEPAINYANHGFKISKFQAFCMDLLAPILLNSTEGKSIYAPQGNLLKEGDLCYMKNLANTLDFLSKTNEQEFYQGEIAHQLVKDCQEFGGYLTLEDLKNYQVIIKKPLKINYRGHDLLTNPPPSSGGALIAFTLKLLESINLDQVEFNSIKHREILAQVMSLTNEARKDGYDQHIYHPNIVNNFLAWEYLKSYQNTFINTINKWGSTTHISVIDKDGNAASVTSSNGEGSGYIIPNTGVMVNNMLGEEDLNPFGFHQWQCNQRISSMMSPTIVLKNGKPEIVLGSGGSNRIRTAILQVISNLLDFNLSIKEAVESPRIHWENNVLSIEPPFREDIERLTLPDLEKVVLWRDKNMFFGGVNAVIKTESGYVDGAGDPRREGAFLIVDG
jgi:gamma-glutamyltranspeptidase/glutathione hydrolase